MAGAPGRGGGCSYRPLARSSLPVPSYHSCSLTKPLRKLTDRIPFAHCGGAFWRGCRWWWESSASKECGLHKASDSASPSSSAPAAAAAAAAAPAAAVPAQAPPSTELLSSTPISASGSLLRASAPAPAASDSSNGASAPAPLSREEQPWPDLYVSPHVTGLSREQLDSLVCARISLEHLLFSHLSSCFSLTRCPLWLDASPGRCLRCGATAYVVPPWLMPVLAAGRRRLCPPGCALQLASGRLCALVPSLSGEGRASGSCCAACNVALLLESS